MAIPQATKIEIEVSARHCHITKQDLAKLFGRGYRLTKLKTLSQPYEFAARETVALQTAGGRIDQIRIVGPERKKTQIELSRTDARQLKIKPPLRVSGDTKGSAGGRLIGPKGEIKLTEGIITPRRHIHCDPATAQKLGLKNGQIVSVKTSGERAVTLHNIIIRIKPEYGLRLHLDTDEGNAALPGGVCGWGELIKE